MQDPDGTWWSDDRQCYCAGNQMGSLPRDQQHERFESATSAISAASLVHRNATRHCVHLECGRRSKQISTKLHRTLSAAAAASIRNKSADVGLCTRSGDL